MNSSNYNGDKEYSRRTDHYVDPEFQKYIEAVALAILNGETTIEAEHDMLVQNCSMFNADSEQIENVLKELKSAFFDAISSGSPYSRKYVGMLCAQCNASDNFSETVDAKISKTIRECKQKSEAERKRMEMEESKRRAEEAEKKRKAEEERKRREQEEANRKAEEKAKEEARKEAQRRAEEAEKKRKAEEERKRREQEEANRKAEEKAKEEARKEAQRRVEEAELEQKEYDSCTTLDDYQNFLKRFPDSQFKFSALIAIKILQNKESQYSKQSNAINPNHQQNINKRSKEIDNVVIQKSNHDIGLNNDLVLGAGKYFFIISLAISTIYLLGIIVGPHYWSGCFLVQKILLILYIAVCIHGFKLNSYDVDISRLKRGLYIWALFIVLSELFFVLFGEYEVVIVYFAIGFLVYMLVWFQTKLFPLLVLAVLILMSNPIFLPQSFQTNNLGSLITMFTYTWCVWGLRKKMSSLSKYIKRG